ncbi:MAG: hypothetical protein ABI165_01985 [Bryobacteraceae bacterium]
MVTQSDLPSPNLSAEEWSVIVELLRHEQRDLPAEIHHTHTPDFHDRLNRRLQTVTGILERLQSLAEDAPPITKHDLGDTRFPAAPVL